MAAETQLLWTVSESAPTTETEHVFSYDPVIGMTDMDFHVITEEDWDSMRCPDDQTAATLVVPPSSRLDEIQQCLDLLATKGGFKNIRVSLRQS